MLVLVLVLHVTVKVIKLYGGQGPRAVYYLLLLLLFLEQSLSTRPGKQLLHPLEAASGTALAGDVLSNDFRNAKRTSL